MKPNQTEWLTWGILTGVVLAISLFFGVQYPLPTPPEEYPEPVPLAANFTNPVDIEGTSSAAAPALTFEDDTDTGIFRSAANTLNIASGGTEMLEIDSAGFTIASTALDVDSSVDADVTSFTVDASGSIDLTSTEAAADAIHLDANGAVTTGIDIDLGSVSGMTIDGGLVDIGGASADQADGDKDLVVAGDFEVDTESLFQDKVTLDGNMLDVGMGEYTYANGDNDVGIAADLEVLGTSYLDADVELTGGNTIYASAHTTGTHGVLMMCSGSHSHSDAENSVDICDIPANANIVDYYYYLVTDWNDGSSAAVDCGIEGGDTDAIVDADDVNGIGNDTLIRAGADAQHPAPIGNVGGSAVTIACQVAEGDDDATEGLAYLFVTYQID